MSKETPLTRLDKAQETFIDNLVYGKEEDVFVRHARKREFKEKYGNRHLAAWLPGWYAYVNIRDDIKNPELTTKQKVALCAVDVGLELVLDAVRVGCVYGLYKFADYLF